MSTQGFNIKEQNCWGNSPGNIQFNEKRNKFYQVFISTVNSHQGTYQFDLNI